MKYVTLTDQLYNYLVDCRSDANDPVLSDLRAETLALGDDSRMLISAEQGTFLSVMTAAIGARRALEVGTFTGYSSICISRALSAEGRLVCIDESEEWTGIAKRYWARAGLEEKIELQLSEAIPALKALPSEPAFDLAFIDAAKEEYDDYYELVLPRVRSNGLILFDNMLWGGRLGQGPIEAESGQAIDRLNHKLARDDRVEVVLLTIADGIQLCRKR